MILNVISVISDLVSSEVQHYLLFRESEKGFWEDGIMLSQRAAGGYKKICDSVFKM